METITHGLIGAALCSRTGLAGGQRGAINRRNVPRLTDWTLWTALVFGMFPDLFSIGLHLIYHVLCHGSMGWHAIPPWVFALYYCTHSLLIAGLFVLIGAWFSRPLAAAMLAWPLHILTDMLTHGPGRFATPIFFPVSDYRFSGINWWETPWLFHWPLAVMAVAWLLLLRYRHRRLRLAEASP